MKIDWINVAVWSTIIVGSIAFWAFIGYLLGSLIIGMVP